MSASVWLDNSGLAAPVAALDALGPVSVDALWDGRITLVQPARGAGYRFTLDAVLLANFVATQPGAEAVELGAGCGVVSTLLLATDRVARVRAVERQAKLAHCARHNAVRNKLSERLRVDEGDLRALQGPVVDMVLFNPPYTRAGAGRPSLCSSRDAARREVHGTLGDFVATAARLLRPAGVAYAIVPYARGAELRGLWQNAGLTPWRERPVRGQPNRPYGHLLSAARKKAAGPLWREPPLTVHDGGPRGYSEEVTAMLAAP